MYVAQCLMGFFDVNVMFKLFTFVFACRMLCDIFSLSVICLLCQMPTLCSLFFFFFFLPVVLLRW